MRVAGGERIIARVHQGVGDGARALGVREDSSRRPLGVLSLAVWQGKLIGGAGDHSIRAWGVGTRAHGATLVGHAVRVCGLVVHDDRLLSASEDGTIRESLRTVSRRRRMHQ